MKRLFAMLLLGAVVLLATPGPRADAQTPAGSPAPAATETDDDPRRPWGRLAFFVPISLAVGAGAVYGRRLARDRGWFGS
jgi:hypothetical protein